MATINPYLSFNGNCEEAFLFYQSIFGGEFPYVGRFKDMPPEYGVAADEQNKIMHVSLPISNETVLMGSDLLKSQASKFNPGNNVTLSINAQSEDEAKKLFEKLLDHGSLLMPLEKTFWDSLFGQVTDKFGIQWMINYHYNPK